VSSGGSGLGFHPSGNHNNSSVSCSIVGAKNLKVVPADILENAKTLEDRHGVFLYELSDNRADLLEDLVTKGPV